MNIYVWVVYIKVWTQCRSMSEHHKDMCLKDIGLRAQMLLIILGLITNNIGGEQQPLHISK